MSEVLSISDEPRVFVVGASYTQFQRWRDEHKPDRVIFVNCRERIHGYEFSARDTVHYLDSAPDIPGITQIVDYIRTHVRRP